MATYLVMHTPKTAEELAVDDMVRPPTRLRELAEVHGADDAEPRWLTTWSPDLHEERLFSLWEAVDAKVIADVIESYGFLDDMVAHPIRVQPWGPKDVLTVED
ncbi:MAG: hypothetical protein WKF81_05165 [Thermomicrobiales bacterium]